MESLEECRNYLLPPTDAPATFLLGVIVTFSLLQILAAVKKTPWNSIIYVILKLYVCNRSSNIFFDVVSDNENNLERSSSNIVTPWTPLPIPTLWYLQILNGPCWVQNTMKYGCRSRGYGSRSSAYKLHHISPISPTRSCRFQICWRNHSVRLDKDFQEESWCYIIVVRGSRCLVCRKRLGLQQSTQIFNIIKILKYCSVSPPCTLTALAGNTSFDCC